MAEMLDERLDLPTRLVAAGNAAGAALAAEATATRATEPSRMDFALAAAQERHLTGLLGHAAEGLVETLSELRDDHAIWDSLGASAADYERNPPTPRQAMLLQELLAHEIPPMLDALGYRPPPDSDHWVRQVQRPLQAMVDRPVTQPPSNLAVVTARMELRFLVRRLEELAERARHSDAGLEKVDPERPTPLRRALSATVRVGRSKALWAAIGAAAGAGALTVFAPGAGVGLALLATMAPAAAGAGAQELIKSAVEATSTHLLGQSDSGPAVRPQHQVASAYRRLDAIFHDTVDDLMHGEDAEPYRFLLRRALFEVLEAVDRAEDDSDPASSGRWLRHEAERLLSELRPPVDLHRLQAAYADFADQSWHFGHYDPEG
jgi:hypothetical protein